MVGELAVALRDLLAEGAIAVHGEVEALVFHVEGQAHGVVRVRIADHRLVARVLVHLAVTVHIYELHVTGLDAGALEGIGLVAAAVAGQVVLKVGLVLDDAFHLVAPEVTDRIADFNAIKLRRVLRDRILRTVDEALSVGKTGDPVLIVGEGGGHTVGEVAAHHVVPGQEDFITPVPDITAVDIRGAGTVREQNRGLYQPVLGHLVVPVEGQAETAAEEAGVET